jgi:hypothetical protein
MRIKCSGTQKDMVANEMADIAIYIHLENSHTMQKQSYAISIAWNSCLTVKGFSKHGFFKLLINLVIASV